MSTWQKRKLGDLVEINKSSIKKNFPHEEILYVDISSVGTGKLESTQKVDITDAPSRAKRLVQNGDSILATVRPSNRSFLYVKQPPQNLVVSTGFAVLSPKEINPRFLYYTISNQSFTDYLAKNAKGAAYPAVDEGIIARAEVFYTDLVTQRQIGDFLGTYDDLIENNEKRIKLLEQSAALLYSKWFSNRVKGGCEVKSLGDLIKISKGKNITKSTVTEGVVPVVAGGLSPAYYHNASNTKAPVITISASGANAGFARLYFENVWASDCSYIDTSSTPYVYFYYLFLISKQDDINRLKRGSAQPHVYPKDIMQLPIEYPGDKLISEFSNLISPLFECIGNLERVNSILAKIRDLLIPQLVTGKRELKNV